MTTPMMTLRESVMFFACLGLGSGLLRCLARSPGERRLRSVMLAAFWLRVALGVSLYAISYYHAPILRSLQVQDGFWIFGLDARLYHAWAVSIADAWTHGIELSNGSAYDYLVLIAAVYRVLGAHPLYAVLLHGWLGALTGWLAYRIGWQLFDARRALRAACFISFWPSALFWSSQIMRDVLCWCLILAILWFVVLAVAPDAQDRRRGAVRWRRWAGLVIGLAAATMLLTRLRVYLGTVLSLVALVVLIPAGCASLMNRRVGRVVRLVSLTALVIGAVVVARDLDTTRLYSPAHPEQGHVRLGLQHQQHGELALAEAEFRWAIDVRPDYQAAYLLWAGMLSAANRPQEALAVCTSWPHADTDGAMGRCVEQLKASSGTQQVVDAPPKPAQAPAPRAPAAPEASAGRAERRNTRPEVEAGPAQTVRDPQSVVLKGLVHDDGLPANTLTYQWTQLLGPPASFATPNALETAVQLPERGRYHFRLTVSDGELIGVDELFVTVEGFVVSMPMAPVVTSARRLASEVGQPASTPQTLSAGARAAQLGTRGLALIQEMSPHRLVSLRDCVIAGGGHTVVDKQADISQPLDLLGYLPRALFIGFLAPFPGQWFDTSGSTGGMRVFAGVEMFLVYVLLVGLVLRAWQARRRIWDSGVIGCVRLAIQHLRLGGIFLLVFGLMLGASVSFVMANLGTLFRIRMLFWLPLLILVAAGDPLGSYAWYRRLVDWLVRRLDRWHGGSRLAPLGAAQDAAGPTAPAVFAGAPEDRD